jgi:hypothetical protein
VFFSDDGSTAVEVALKMAFRKYLVDHRLVAAASSTPVTLEVGGGRGGGRGSRGGGGGIWGGVGAGGGGGGVAGGRWGKKWAPA